MKDIAVQRFHFHSWQSAREDFAPVLEKLLAGAWRECKVIYQTRNKECRLVLPEFSGLPYAAVLKLYREQRFFRYLFRPSLAYREYLGFQRTSIAGIPTARVLALGEKRAGLRLQEAFFVTEYLDGYRDGSETTAPDFDRKLRDEFIRINLGYLAKLHKTGLIHGGFHTRNELFQLADDGSMLVKWIDLATVAPESWTGRFSREKDLKLFMKKFRFSAAEEAGYMDFYRDRLKI